MEREHSLTIGNLISLIGAKVAYLIYLSKCTVKPARAQSKLALIYEVVQSSVHAPRFRSRLTLIVLRNQYYVYSAIYVNCLVRVTSVSYILNQNIGKPNGNKQNGKPTKHFNINFL